MLGIGAVALGQGLLLTGTALVAGMAVGLDRLPEGTPAPIAVTLLWFLIGILRGGSRLTLRQAWRAQPS